MSLTLMILVLWAIITQLLLPLVILLLAALVFILVVVRVYTKLKH